MMNSMDRLIPVWETIGMGWEKTNGAKGTIWGAIIILILIAAGVGMFAYVLKALLPSLSSVINFMTQVIIILLQIGLLYIGIRKSRNLPISVSNLFFTFSQVSVFVNVLLLFFFEILIYAVIALITVGLYSIVDPISSFISSIVFILSAFLMIYIGVKISLSLAFIFDQDLNAIAAIKASFVSTRKNFWRLLGIYIIKMALLIVSIIPLLIGLIWTIPFLNVCYGVIYKRLALNDYT